MPRSWIRPRPTASFATDFTDAFPSSTAERRLYSAHHLSDSHCNRWRVLGDTSSCTVIDRRTQMPSLTRSAGAGGTTSGRSSESGRCIVKSRSGHLHFLARR